MTVAMSRNTTDDWLLCQQRPYNTVAMSRYMHNKLTCYNSNIKQNNIAFFLWTERVGYVIENMSLASLCQLQFILVCVYFIETTKLSCIYVISIVYQVTNHVGRSTSSTHQTYETQATFERDAVLKMMSIYCQKSTTCIETISNVICTCSLNCLPVLHVCILRRQ